MGEHRLCVAQQRQWATALFVFEVTPIVGEEGPQIACLKPDKAVSAYRLRSV